MNHVLARETRYIGARSTNPALFDNRDTQAPLRECPGKELRSFAAPQNDKVELFRCVIGELIVFRHRFLLSAASPHALEIAPRGSRLSRIEGLLVELALGDRGADQASRLNLVKQLFRFSFAQYGVR
jgi:hypothetical protein